jgi:hypothetical protein
MATTVRKRNRLGIVWYPDSDVADIHGPFSCELRNQADTSKFTMLARFSGLEAACAAAVELQEFPNPSH